MSKLDELREKNLSALSGGGEEKIQMQHDAGKKTARERIDLLLDPGSFVEIDKFIKKTIFTPGSEAASETGEGVVCGYGTINGGPVFLYAQDYTVLSGSLSAAHASKILRVMDMAAKNGVPVIGILDSGGARISEGIAAIESSALILNKLAELSGVIPTIAIIAGPCVGTAAYIAALSNFAFMVEGISYLSLHGPQIYGSAIGKPIVAAEEFGARNHAVNTGVSEFWCANEEECIAIVKQLLSYLPSNNLDEAPFDANTDDLNRQLALNEGSITDVKTILSQIADHNRYFEVGVDYAPGMVTAFARLGGNVCAFILNAVREITGAEANKAARFVSFADAFNIPIITVINCMGTKIDIENEQANLILDITRLIGAYAQAGVAKISLIVGDAIGDGFAMMGSKALGADMIFAWPDAVITSIPPEAGALLMYQDEIAKAQDGIAAKREMIQKYIDEYANPWQAAEQGVVDSVIEPAHTRQVLISALEMNLSKRENKLPKKHGVLLL